MSMSDLMVLRGRVGTNLTLHRPEDGGGRSFVRFRMVIPRARRNDSGKWEDGEPKWHTIRAWGPLAENMRVLFERGSPWSSSDDPRLMRGLARMVRYARNLRSTRSRPDMTWALG